MGRVRRSTSLKELGKRIKYMRNCGKEVCDEQCRIPELEATAQLLLDALRKKPLEEQLFEKWRPVFERLAKE